MKSYFSYLRIIEDKVWRKIRYFCIRYFCIRYFDFRYFDIRYFAICYFGPSIFVFRHFFI